MDQINAFFDSVDVFKKLGIDSTVIFQFVIFLITFRVLKSLLFTKLLDVLQLREAQTIKRENSANDKFAEVEKLSEKYNSEIKKAHSKSQSKFSEKRALIVDEQKSRFKSEESKANSLFSEQRDLIMKEFDTKKAEIIKNADDLARDLSNKLTN